MTARADRLTHGDRTPDNAGLFGPPILRRSCVAVSTDWLRTGSVMHIRIERARLGGRSGHHFDC